MQRQFFREQGWLHVDGSTLFDYENTKKSTDLTTFESYWIDFNQRIPILETHYSKRAYRKMRLYRYCNEQRSEAKFINKFKNLYGTDCTVVIGAWDASNCRIRGCPPTKGKGFRDMFRNAGYQVVLLQEHNTSSKCLNCEAQLDKKFSYRESPKPHIRRRNRLENPTNPRKYPVHGILRCRSRQCRAAVATKLLEKAQTIEQRFPTNAVKLAQAQAIRSRLEMATLFPNDPTWATFRYWNRDDVATGNFKKKVEFMIANNGEIPLYLQRQQILPGQFSLQQDLEQVPPSI
jgi:hypothetical protein